jgi:hypothetical protein
VHAVIPLRVARNIAPLLGPVHRRILGTIVTKPQNMVASTESSVLLFLRP